MAQESKTVDSPRSAPAFVAEGGSHSEVLYAGPRTHVLVCDSYSSFAR